MEMIMYQLENEPTGGKRDGDKRIKAKTRRSTQLARYGELTAIRRLEWLETI